jgi:hypothetical protein
MIPEIGILVAAYVFVRMLELLTDRTTATVIRVFAGVVTVIAAVVAADLIRSGTNVPSVPGLGSR